MPAWALRAIAIVVTGLTMLGSTGYALAHPKNPNAPLQPPVAERPQASREPEPDLTTAQPFRTLAPTEPPTPSPSPTPRPTGVSTVARATAAPTIAPTPRPTGTLRATPVPQITLAAGVRATALPKITITHSS